MIIMTRVALPGSQNTLPVLPETAHMSPEERSKYTFVLDVDQEHYALTEDDAKDLTPLASAMSVGQVWIPIK